MHSHVHASCSPSAAAGRRLGLALLLSLATASGELWGARHSGSLALLADAGHVAFDSLAIALAWAALQIGRRPPSPHMPFGYGRVEVLAATGNALALLGVAAALAYGGASRIANPQPVEVGTMMGAAAVGLVGNALSLCLLESCRDNVGVRAAFLHVAGDVLVALAVLAGGLMMRLTGYNSLDGWLTVAVSGVLAAGAVRLLGSVGRVLVQAAPAKPSPSEVRAAIAAVAGVSQVMELMLWSLTPNAHVLSCHVALAAAHDRAPTAVSDAIAALCRERFGILRSTVQVHRAVAGQHER